MKNFGRLTKGIVGEVVFIAVILLIFLTVCIFYGEDSTFEEFAVRVVISLIFCVIALFVGGVYLIVVACAYHKAKAKLRAIPGFSEERFERETERTPRFNHILPCSDAICYAGDGHIVKVVPLADVIWAYQEQDRHMLLLYTKNKEKHMIKVTVNVKKDKKAKKDKKDKGILKNNISNAEKGIGYLLRLIVRKNKNVIIGYDESYEKMYKKDFDRLLVKASGREIINSALLEQEYIQNDYYHKDFQ